MCSPFGNYSALCKFLDINKSRLSYFTLEHKGYNSLTLNYLILEVAYSYNAKNFKYSEVARVLELKENYAYSENMTNKQEEINNNKKKQNQDLLNFENQYQNKKSFEKKKQKKIIKINQNKKSDQFEDNLFVTNINTDKTQIEIENINSESNKS
ncbi:8843_t:CDS:2 [Scutellospora calospora]|uniref:8843_t:CDS:1 n=1 Tax=Scutellospora calospora TaxID=85575 RepID=A0ACA9KB37_9GLOM|nr:8843_t:CDS:2 [Scutellospora calospora]